MGFMKRVASGDEMAVSKLIFHLNQLGYPSAGDRFVDLVWRTQQRPGRTLTERPAADDAGLDTVPAAVAPPSPAAPAKQGQTFDVTKVGPPPPPPVATATAQGAAVRLGLRTAASLRAKGR